MVKQLIKSYTLVWTAPGGNLAQADDIADDDATVIPTEHCSDILVCWDTNDADTGAPNFDFHVEVDIDGTNYTDTHYATLVEAAAKDVRGAAMLTVPRRSIMITMDLNAADLTATETVTVYVYVFR